MTDQDRENEDSPGGAERLFEALRNVATDDGTRETLRELGARARGIVEDLASNARQRAAAAEARAAADAASARREREAAHGAGRPDAGLTVELQSRLVELRSCVDEVADTLEATVERLETIEGQLGDPGDRVEARLAQGLEHCRHLLMGLEHRIARAAVTAGPDAEPPAEAPLVLVVAVDSAIRAGICVDLEKQGLRCVAASDFARALRVAGSRRPQAALVVPAGDPSARVELMDDWKEGEEQGSLPPAVVLVAGRPGDGLREQAAAFGFPFVGKEHGAAALAASLLRAMRGHGDADETAIENGPGDRMPGDQDLQEQ